jgi:hypothetical protein
MVNDNNNNTDAGQGAEDVVTPVSPAPESQPVAEVPVQGAVVAPPAAIDFSTIMNQVNSGSMAPSHDEDDIVRQVRDLRGQGLSASEISTRLSVGSMDFSKMSQREIIVQKTMVETGLDKNTVTEALEDTYGIEGSENAVQRLKLAQDAHQAKDYLSKMTVKQEKKPEAPVVDTTKIRESWSLVGDSILSATKTLPFSVKDKDLDYSGAFNIPEDIIAKIKPLVVDYAVSNGLPFTQESGQQLQEFAENLIFVAGREQIISTYIRDAYAKGLQKGAEIGTGGNLVVNDPKAVRTNTQADFDRKILEKMEGRN